MACAPDLPPARRLNTGALAAAFRGRSASYKYLWMQAILRAVERGEFDGGPAPMALLAAHMLDIAKYPLRRFRLSLGWHGHDKVGQVLRDLEDAEGWHDLRTNLLDRDIAARFQQMPAFAYSNLVALPPYRFLTPFFGDQLRNLSAAARHRRIAALADRDFRSDSPPLYRFTQDSRSIELHPSWAAYIRDNLEILRGWALWHWCDYLQGRNPNTPAIARKLARPAAAGLTKQREFWRWVIGARAGQVRCIYSGQPLRAQDFAVDHYIPWDFIGHDNLWNLVPARPEANSSKSNRLPHPRYLPQLVQTQHLALATLRGSGRTQWESLMECYTTDLRLPTTDPVPPPGDLQRAFSQVALPLLQLAENQGFESGWAWGEGG